MMPDEQPRKAAPAKDKAPKPEQTPEEEAAQDDGILLGSLKEGARKIVEMTGIEHAPGGEAIKGFLLRATGNVMEKTEEVSRVMKLRMAILDIEHHLNRLYPDIGKTTYDLWAKKETPLLDNPSLRSKIEMVHDYRNRLDDLRAQLKEANEKKDK
ncbi:MAG: hypothetical protein OEV94_07335 [Deltaproteobacteria bacterium]|nr:hypothetical protein [Deltaproteobacteria bacterium]